MNVLLYLKLLLFLNDTLIMRMLNELSPSVDGLFLFLDYRLNVKK